MPSVRVQLHLGLITDAPCALCMHVRVVMCGYMHVCVCVCLRDRDSWVSVSVNLIPQLQLRQLKTDHIGMGMCVWLSAHTNGTCMCAGLDYYKAIHPAAESWTSDAVLPHYPLTLKSIFPSHLRVMWPHQRLWYGVHTGLVIAKLTAAGRQCEEHLVHWREKEK